MGSFFHFLAQSFLRQKMKKAPIHPPIASYQVKRGWLVTPYFSSVRCCFRYYSIEQKINKIDVADE